MADKDSSTKEVSIEEWDPNSDKETWDSQISKVSKASKVSKDLTKTHSNNMKWEQKTSKWNYPTKDSNTVTNNMKCWDPNTNKSSQNSTHKPELSMLSSSATVTPL